jgi:uncharacterized protein YndB with AHSA1/START domain
VDRKHEGRQIRAQVRTRATPQQVWDAWTDPEKIAHWFVDRASGKPVVGSIFTWVFEKFGYEIPDALRVLAGRLGAGVGVGR